MPWLLCAGIPSTSNEHNAFDFAEKNESNQSTEPSQPDCEYGKTGWYEIKSESMER